MTVRKTIHQNPLAPNAPCLRSNFNGRFRTVKLCLGHIFLTVTWVAQDLNPLPVYLASSCSADMPAPMNSSVLSSKEIFVKWFHSRAIITALDNIRASSLNTASTFGDRRCFRKHGDKREAGELTTWFGPQFQHCPRNGKRLYGPQDDHCD